MTAINPVVFISSLLLRVYLPRDFARATRGHDGLSERENTQSLHFATVYCLEYIDKKSSSRYRISEWNTL